jgi:hypothetical protein
MTETQMLCETSMRPARAQDENAGLRTHPPRLPGRVIARLRALLRAQALLNGSCGGPYDVTFIEDDRTRLSGRRER